MNLTDTLAQTDPELKKAIDSELSRQRNKLELIASENIVSRAVLEAQGSVLTNKYAEGYPGKRYYGGCECVDVVEQIAIDRAKKVFGAAYANVQPHSGAQANMAVFFALLSPGDTVMGLSLTDGGHLTHGSPVNMSGMYFKIVPYGVSKETETIDYDALEKQATETKPMLIVAGASAYARILDFPRLSEIAKKVGAYLMVDIAHIAGLVAAGLHPNPISYADVVTTTTHKTLRGPRGGLILTNDETIAKKINSALIYKNDRVRAKMEEVVRPMMEEMYARLLSDLVGKRYASPIFTYHIRYVNEAHYRRALPYEDGEPNRIVTDYIASMTDDYFVDLYAYLFPDSRRRIEYHGYFD